MNILLVAATAAEIAPLMQQLTEKNAAATEGRFIWKDHNLQVLLTGVGMMQATWALTSTLSRATFDLALQVGVAGSYDRHLPLGTLVQVVDELIGDLGAEDHYAFLDVFQLGLADPDTFPFSGGRLPAPHLAQAPTGLPRVSGCTVNMVSGSTYTATLRAKQLKCTVESMEGAAFHFVCLHHKIPFLQVRAISNYVEARNRGAWNMGAAITNLNNWLQAFPESI